MSAGTDHDDPRVQALELKVQGLTIAVVLLTVSVLIGLVVLAAVAL